MIGDQNLEEEVLKIRERRAERANESDVDANASDGASPSPFGAAKRKSVSKARPSRTAVTSNATTLKNTRGSVDSNASAGIKIQSGNRLMFG